MRKEGPPGAERTRSATREQAGEEVRRRQKTEEGRKREERSARPSRPKVDSKRRRGEPDTVSAEGGGLIQRHANWSPKGSHLGREGGRGQITGCVDLHGNFHPNTPSSGRLQVD